MNFVDRLMSQEIPGAVIVVVADVCSEAETHASLDSLFLYAGAPGDPPEGSKHVKALKWLRRLNSKEHTSEPLRVLGKIVEHYIEASVDPNAWNAGHVQSWRSRIIRVLDEQGMQYSNGGHLARHGVATPSKALEVVIREMDYDAVSQEYERALKNIPHSPREAISAAANILESICKIYIEENGLEIPNKQDLKSVFSVVRKDLGIDPSIIEDRDLQEIASGIIGFIGGLAALRTHASTAHGHGKKIYRLEPRHARLAVHGAHTLALFIMETWNKRKSQDKGVNRKYGQVE